MKAEVLDMSTGEWTAKENIADRQDIQEVVDRLEPHQISQWNDAIIDMVDAIIAMRFENKILEFD